MCKVNGSMVIRMCVQVNVLINMIQGVVYPKESCNVYGRSTSITTCQLKLWEYHVLKHNKFSFIHECLVINSCSVTVLDQILIILQKKHLT